MNTRICLAHWTRFCALVLIAVMVVTVGSPTLTTASPLRAEKAEKLTILIPIDWRPIVDWIAPQWQEETGVELEIVSLAYNDVHDKIVSSAQGGADVDIVYVDTIWPGEFAKAGFLMPVDEYVTEEMRQGIDQPLFDQLVWDGQLWAVPFNNQSKWLFYNRNILAEAGYTFPPITWQQMEEMSRDMMEKGLVQYGTAWGWAQAEGLMCDVTLLLHGFGGRWRDEEGAWVFNDQAGQGMMQFMVDSIGPDGWADPASISLNDRTDLNPFLAGNTAFVINWAFAWGLISDPEESQVAGQVGIALIPAAKGTGLRSSSVTGGGGFGILKNSDTPELAGQFLQRMMDREVQTKALELQQNMPIWTEMYSAPEVLEAYPYFEAMGPQFQYAHFRPVLPWYSEWSLQAQVEVQAALTGAKSPPQALDDLAAWCNAKSEEYGY